MPPLSLTVRLFLQDLRSQIIRRPENAMLLLLAAADRFGRAEFRGEREVMMLLSPSTSHLGSLKNQNN